jgi:hypothetical protein
MNSKEASIAGSEHDKFAKVPSDFPRPAVLGAIGGVQPKLLMVRYEGKFYPPGCTPPELYARWDKCEDLARQLAEKSVESKLGKRAHMTEVEILDQYLRRLIGTRWTSEPEARWIIRRVATKLGWPVPPAAHELDTPANYR